MASTAAASGDSRKRKRGAIACGYCRSKKIRCLSTLWKTRCPVTDPRVRPGNAEKDSGINSPCPNCVDRGQVCIKPSAGQHRSRPTINDDSNAADTGLGRLEHVPQRELLIPLVISNVGGSASSRLQSTRRYSEQNATPVSATDHQHGQTDDLRERSSMESSEMVRVDQAPCCHLAQGNLAD